MNKALKITKDAKNATFIGCRMVGETENSGKNTKFIKTEFLKNFPIKHPKTFFGIIIGIIALIASSITIHDKIF